MQVAKCALESQLTGVAGSSGVYTEARGGSLLPETPLSLLPGLGDSDRTCCPNCEPEGLRYTGDAGALRLAALEGARAALPSRLVCDDFSATHLSLQKRL